MADLAPLPPLPAPTASDAEWQEWKAAFSIAQAERAAELNDRMTTAMAQNTAAINAATVASANAVQALGAAAETFAASGIPASLMLEILRLVVGAKGSVG